jgi:hypothetical protein
VHSDWISTHPKKTIEPWGRRWKTIMSVYIAITEIFQKQHNHVDNAYEYILSVGPYLKLNKKAVQHAIANNCESWVTFSELP